MNGDVFSPTNILIPEGVSPEVWSVVACDQFSSDKGYWERVRETVNGAPSTLELIVPEAYLEEINEEAATSKISATMVDYLEHGVLREIKDSFIYLERTLSDGSVRHGLVGAIDLEEYDFKPGAVAIKASEGTVIERLPPRIRVRKAACLELPHVMVFIDDKEATVIEPLSGKTGKLPLLYDFDLMEGGGHIRGMQVSGQDAEGVLEALRALRNKATQDCGGMLMVIGDGNHSLAAAKVYWDELKQGLSAEDRETHPARRALVEINNVYDDAISFEAIHRALFNVDADDVLTAFEKDLSKGEDYILKWASRGRGGTIGLSAACIGDMLFDLQTCLDGYIKRTGCGIDYIHGEAETLELAAGERCLGLVLPAMDKSELFATVAAGRVFPKKSFSVGHAQDKRYYLECRVIREQ